MANIKITDLVALTDPASTDVLPIVDVGADVTKKISIADLLENAGSGTASAPGIAFDGDSNTGIYRPGADQVAISTNGAQALYIDSDGDILVADGNRMEIDEIRARDGDGLKLLDDAGAGIFIQDGGNVGVGTSVPLAPFHLIGIDANNVYDANTDSFLITAGGNQNLRLYVDQTNNKAAVQSVATAAGGNDLLLNPIGGSVGIGTTSPGSALEIDAAAATSPFIAKINTSEAARIDSSGRLLVGTSTARNNFYNTSLDAGLQIENIGSSKRGLALVTNSSVSNPSTLTLAGSNGNAIGSNTLVTNNDWVGNISFQGSDGTEFVPLAYIDAYIDGTPGADDMPGRLVFSVTADGASSPTEAMRIKNSRIINIANTPVYADNAAAKTGGLVDGDVYRTSTGDLKIVYT